MCNLRGRKGRSIGPAVTSQKDGTADLSATRNTIRQWLLYLWQCVCWPIRCFLSFTLHSAASIMASPMWVVWVLCLLWILEVTDRIHQGRRSGYESGGGGRHTCQSREKFWRDERGATERSEPTLEGGSGGPPPENLKKPTWQMVQSTLFLSYICEYY